MTLEFYRFMKTRAQAQPPHIRGEGIPDIIMYTSGTSAKPKGVMLNESMIAAHIQNFAI